MIKNAFGLRVTHELNDRMNLDVRANYSSFKGLNPPRLGGLDAFASYNYGKLFTWMIPRNYDTTYWMPPRSEEHTSALQSLMRTPYAFFCLHNIISTATTVARTASR